MQDARRSPPIRHSRLVRAAAHLTASGPTGTQIAFSHHYFVHDGRCEIFSAPYRHVWPSELDRMARIAGLTLRARWGD
jgi:hypothetical protein